MSTINGRACVANGRNLLVGIDKTVHQASGWFQWVANIPRKFIKVGQPLCFSAFINNAPYAKAMAKGNACCVMQAKDVSGNMLLQSNGNTISFDADGISQVSMVVPNETDAIQTFIVNNNRSMLQNPYYGDPKVEFGSIATPGTPAPVDKAFSNGRQVYGRNLLVGIDKTVHQASGWFQWVANIPRKFIKVGQPLCFSTFINNAPYAKATAKGNAFCIIRAIDSSGNMLLNKNGNVINFDADGVSQVSLIVPDKTTDILLFVMSDLMSQNTYYGYPKAEFGSIATSWTPAPEDVM